MHLVLRFPLSFLLTAEAATDTAACTYCRSGICDCEHELWPTGGMQSTVILILQNHLITSEYEDKKEHLIGVFFFALCRVGSCCSEGADAQKTKSFGKSNQH